ncbi:MAG: SpoIIE family protein phosphatase [Bacteroidetes bacterium]|nr:SpoIIE family protein phosphatase [Bacteroidota bacterium]
MKKITWLILFFFTAKIISAQCDTELKLADAETDDTLKLKSYRKILDCYYAVDDFDGANKLLVKEKSATDKVIQKTKDSVYFRNYLADITTFYFYKGDIKKCSEVSEELMRFDYRKSDSAKLSASVGNLAITYRRMGNYPKAIYYLQEAIKINLKVKRKDLSGNYTNLANVYLDLKNYPKAKFYLESAIKSRTESNDSLGLYHAYMNMGNYYQKLDKFDSSLIFYNKSLWLIPKIKLPKSKTGTIFNNLTALYLEKRNIDSANHYSQIAKEMVSDKANPYFLSMYYLNKGHIAECLNNNAVALENYNIALGYASKNNDLENIVDLTYGKTACFKKMNQMDSAYKTLVLASRLRDSLFNSAKTSEITRYEMQYQFDKEQETEKNEQLKKEIESKHALERKQLLIYAAMIGMILLLGLVLIVLKNNHQKKKDNLLLQQKNDLIEAQKKDIIDSINYAKNLQQAILPPLTKIHQDFKDSFIYYKPKDIIAGDFYWLHKAKSKTDEDIFLFAVADCTGHGVPGALVSVVCSNALDSAVKEFGLTDPGKILDKTKEIVLATFSKTGKNVKDGMDISLCAIQNNKVAGQNKVSINWAGANNSLWYIHNGEIKELTANKQPIGLSEHSHPFTTHHVELDRGDQLYFSTDGYYDQFGGDKSNPSGKKFMRKKLSALFFNIKDKSFDAQLKIIDETFTNWKGALEQIDDVCVAGIKL